MSYGSMSNILKNADEPKKEKQKDNSEQLLYQSILEGSVVTKVRTSDKIGRLYASESGHCYRKGTLSAIEDKPADMQPTFLYYTEIGKTVENCIIESLAKKEVLLFPNTNDLTEQFRIPDVGLNLGGKLDGVVYINNKIYLLEIKTAGQKMPNDPAKEKPQHLAQARIYSGLLGIDIDLLYFARNVSSDMYGESLKIKEFIYKFDRGVVYDTLFNSCISSYCVENKLIPPIPDFINDKNKKDMCGYCNHTSYCWNSGNNNYDLRIPSEQEIKIMREFAHNKTGELLNAKNVKLRKENFYDEISLKGNQKLVKSINFLSNK